MAQIICTILCTLMTAAATVVVAAIGKKTAKTNSENETREERRREESLLNLEMTIASMDLTEVCANALTGGHNNGNVEEAREKVRACREKYKEFQRRVIAEEL